MKKIQIILWIQYPEAFPVKEDVDLDDDMTEEGDDEMNIEGLETDEEDDEEEIEESMDNIEDLEVADED